MQTTLVFVYGTLRRGQPGHHVLSGAAHVKDAVTPPVYTMVNLGEYPALIAGGRTSIVGEIYRVDAPGLATLDEYEDVPDLYRRVTVLIAGMAADLYVLAPEHASVPLHSPAVIHSGDWLRRGR